MDVGSRMVQLGGSRTHRRRRWLQFRRAAAVVGGGDCGMVLVQKREREGKLGLGFWLCERERVMKCHFMIGYFSE